MPQWLVRVPLAGVVLVAVADAADATAAHAAALTAAHEYITFGFAASSGCVLFCDVGENVAQIDAACIAATGVSIALTTTSE